MSAKETEAAPKKGAKKKVNEEELSEQDQHLKDHLEQYVEKLTQSGSSKLSSEEDLKSLKTIIQESTTSMTAVPKPLKFLRPFYPTLTELYKSWEGQYGAKDDIVLKLADILSILAMTYSDDSNKESLKYRLASSDEYLHDWGHEYLRHLALEIGESYQENLGNDETYVKKLVDLSLQFVPFFLKHNAEADAVDLLLEIESVDKLAQFVDETTYSRVCLYMISCVPLLAPPDDVIFLQTAYNISLKHKQYARALTLAIRLDDAELSKKVFDSTDDQLMHVQLGFILSQSKEYFKYSGENQDVINAISNTNLHSYYSYLVKELNLLDPKVPEDIYKSHLENSKFGLGNSGSIDSAKQNLAAAFVNGFINLGYGTDRLIQTEEDNKSWIYKTKGLGMVSTTASLGLVHEWDINDGLQVLDKYTYAEEEIKAGALLGTGVVSANVHDDVDAALALLQEYVNDPVKLFQSSAIIGLGIAFAGTSNEEVLNLLLPILLDVETSLEASSLAALSLGFVFVGTCHEEVTSTILQTFLERDFSQLTNKFIKFMSLGLGLLYIGRTEQADDVLETIDAINHPINKTLKVLVNVCAYAGTGNVLQIQSLLQMCTPRSSAPEEKAEDDEEEDQAKDEESEKAEKAEKAEKTEVADGEVKTEGNGMDATNDEEKAEKEESKEKEEDKEEELFQGIAVLGVACIAMGEDIGQDMSLRHFSHLMHYGNSLIRRVVPLAMGLVSVSNPQMKVFDTLSRYSHDPDLEVSQNAIYAMGLVGAGTNNARLAQLLRQLASYYIKSADTLFMVRIAQGLLHLGKGTSTLSPFTSERSFISKVSLASLLTIAVALVDPKDFILGDSNSETSHQLLYYLTPAIKPRMLITLDESLNPIKVNVCVGQAVDVVGQAGKPKTITGWVTQSTPVLLNHGERAELENNEEWITLTSALEGIVILKKNPEYMEVDNS